MATDDISGVNYTMYKLDSGEWNEYNSPFVVTESGQHTIYFYSVDNAGNEEEIKSCTFNIACKISMQFFEGWSLFTILVKKTTTRHPRFMLIYKVVTYCLNGIQA